MATDMASSTAPLEQKELQADCSRPEVTTKYQTAAGIANEVLERVLQECKPGADIATLCKLGDELIEEKAQKVYSKKEKGESIRRGVAFPTCVTANELVANFSPLISESKQLNHGDMVKVELGCHIDGFIATAGHTIVLPSADGEQSITGRKADVIRAAWAAAEAALRTITVGNTNNEVTRVMALCAEDFKCSMVSSQLSYQLKQHVIDGVKSICNRASSEEKVDSIEFEPNEAYSMNVLVSTGDGKVRESELRTTVFKRDVEQNYSLKTSLARQFLREATMRFPSLPFSARSIPDEKCARLGISECCRHNLLQPYPTLTEKAGEYIAHFNFTVLLLPGGTKRIAGLSALMQDSLLKSEFEITNEEMKNLLASSASSKKKKKRAKKEGANTQ